ncbi:MAG: replication-associated recombination protein A [Deltaproteobacteria bacterium]|nr:replication-associated recombination protein A [Deltaproteobacteria bacterium]MBN2674590.1 replication-associated recombination protein A [Deltaproteobacteria bacterium]
MTDDLFGHAAKSDNTLTPLPDRMRPVSLDEIAGQTHLLGSGRFLERAIRSDRVPSLIFWGPPGVGKTTLARVLASHTGANFVAYSAVGGSIKEVRDIIHKAKTQRAHYRRRTILFIDEIHRFNKAQQDALLPSVEQGVVTLIGATTENPSFSVIAALLSRCKVLELKPLAPDDVVTVMRRALNDETRGFGSYQVNVDDDAMQFLAQSARGDARYALTALEMSVHHALEKERPVVDIACVEEAANTKALLYDKSGEEHYNVVSAFIKSMRGSDPDAALYWMFRMLEAGDDPLFVLRRMIIFASEDVGNADPRALQLAVAADQAFQRIGMPEGAYPMAQLCTYLASAPKSNAQVNAIYGPKADIKKHGPLPVPKKLRNAPTSLMKEMGYGEGYRYPPSEGGYATGETYLPEQLTGTRYYEPQNAGLEQRIAEHLENLRKSR